MKIANIVRFFSPKSRPKKMGPMDAALARARLAINPPATDPSTSQRQDDGRTDSFTADSPVLSGLDDLQPLPHAMGVYPNAQPVGLSEMVGVGRQKPPAVRPTLLVGESGARYLRGPRLATGGFGKVYLAMREDGEQVAVKVLRLPERAKLSSVLNGQPVNKPRLTQVSNLKSIEEENATLAQVGAYVRPQDHGQGLGRFFLVMPMMAGSLLDFVASAKLNKKKDRQALGALARAALAAASTALSSGEGEHYVHRDIKPENLLMAQDGSVHLADWGLAARLTDGQDTVSGYSGTPPYRAPETRRDGIAYKQSDTYSLGLTAAQICTGLNPLWETKDASGKEIRGGVGERQRALKAWIENSPKLSTGAINFPGVALRHRVAIFNPRKEANSNLDLLIDRWAMKLSLAMGDSDADHILQRMLCHAPQDRELPAQTAQRFTKPAPDAQTTLRLKKLTKSTLGRLDSWAQMHFDELSLEWKDLAHVR